MKRSSERNAEIKRRIDELRSAGWQVQQAIRIVAPQYYLSERRVRNIYYNE